MGKLEKNILGEEGDRSLMQQFNTQFLDPRAYPYYAQKFARGAVNIPELIFRFPFGITGVARDFITGETGKAERFGETMDPKLTRKIVERDRRSIRYIICTDRRRRRKKNKSQK